MFIHRRKDNNPYLVPKFRSRTASYKSGRLHKGGVDGIRRLPYVSLVITERLSYTARERSMCNEHVLRAVTKGLKSSVEAGGVFSV